MTKRQKRNLNVGLIFLAAGILFILSLRSKEGSIETRNGASYLYSVDPNVYIILSIVSLIGVLIIIMALVDSRGQTSTVGRRAIEPLTAEKFMPIPEYRTESLKPEKTIPERIEAIGLCPMCGKVIVMGQTECVKCGWRVIRDRLVRLTNI